MINIKPYGESGLILQLENVISLEVHSQVKQYYRYLLESKTPGILSLIPAYTSITILFDLQKTNFETLKETILAINLESFHKQPTKIVEIPVCYDLSLGIDLEEVAELKKCSIDKIIQLHTQPYYTVYMLGFSPGFMYLGGLSPQLFTPRKTTPRLKINAGSVGLADQQTGIYPSATPGGWQIIGQTPISIFEVNEKPLVQMGDQVKFTSIDIETYNKMIL